MRRLLAVVIAAFIIGCGSLDAAWSAPTTITKFSAGATGGTSSSVTTSGYTTLIVTVSSYTNGTYTFADAVTSPSCPSPCNTWQTGTRTTANGGAGSSQQIYVAYNPTVGTGHTFSANTGTVIYPTVIVLGFTGGLTASNPIDLSTSNNAAGTSVQPYAAAPGTPAENNELFVIALSSGASVNADMTISGDSFTKFDAVDFNSGGFGALGSAVGYVIQTSGASVNPTWTSTTSTVGLATVMLSLKAPAVATGSRLPLSGVGK